MYMMTSNNDTKEYNKQITYPREILIKTYKKREGMDQGMTDDEIKILDTIVNSSHSMYKEALWFFCLRVLPSLSQWILRGNPELKQVPPPIGSREYFEYYLRGTNKKSCEDLLNGSIGI